MIDTPNLEEFCEHHALEYQQTDTLLEVATPAGTDVLWRRGDEVMGILTGHTVEDVMQWGYINLK